MSSRLQGVLPIIHTPFDEHEAIDWRALKAEVDWAFAQGVNGLGTGMVSEVTRLSVDERREYSQRLVEFVAGRGPVFMSVTADSSDQSLQFAEYAKAAGCDAIMAAPPLAERAEDLGEFYTALADAVPLPLIVQDASGYLGQSIPLSVYLDLLKRFGPQKILFKPEAPPNGPNISALRDATQGAAKIFEGSGGVFLIDSYRRGIAGTMPGMDLVEGILAVWRALERGDEAAAYRLYFPICAIVALQMQAGLDGFLAIEKHLLVRRGLFAFARRRPPIAWELDRETADEVQRLFDQLMEQVEMTKPE
jgi:4-hydroxy-tetrahydrodipicolinate synthase